MANLTITEEKAKQLYPNAPSELKQIFEDTFGKKVFQKDIKDRVKSFWDARVVLDLDPNINISGSEDEVAYKKLKIIVKALNEGWTPDWNDSNQYKWHPWFYLDTPGFRFAGSSTWGTISLIGGGTRLCFRSKGLSDYAASQFLEIYKKYIS